MTSLTPLSRETMLQLKAQKDEEIRQKAEAERKERILKIVTEIYEKAKRVAEESTTTRYAHKLPGVWFRGSALLGGAAPSIVLPLPVKSDKISSESLNDCKMYMDNMEEILAYLRSLFPGCVVEQQLGSFVKGRHGEELDVTTVDKALLSAMRTPTESEVIVIDWS